MPAQVRSADGRYVNTGVSPRRPHEFTLTHQWLEELGLLEHFHAAALLPLGAEREQFDLSKLPSDEDQRAIYGAGQEAMACIASHLTAYDFFIGAQERGPRSSSCRTGS